jgi:hypothetical protein
VSLLLAVTPKVPLKAASSEVRLTVSAPAVAVVSMVSDAVGLAKVMSSPRVESILLLAPAASVGVMVSAAPRNVKLRAQARMVLRRQESYAHKPEAPAKAKRRPSLALPACVPGWGSCLLAGVIGLAVPNIHKCLRLCISPGMQVEGLTADTENEKT